MLLSPEQFNAELLSDPYNKIIFENREAAIFLVGGYIRDIMAGRKSKDRDYVVSGQLEPILQRISARTEGRVVPIGKKGLYRIVCKNGITLDFSCMDGDIGTDLSRRDFTINAMAWSPESGIIDPTGGTGDFSRGLIRMVRPENLAEDPVRIIRAYRLADEFSFRIEELTRKALKAFKNGLKEAKSERITLEFYKILNSQNAISTLHAVDLDEILPALIYNDYEELSYKFKVLSIFFEIIKNLPLKYQLMMNEIFSENLQYRGLLILEILLREGPDNRLNISSRIRTRLRKYGVAEQIFLSAATITGEVLFDMFESAGESAIDFLINTNKLEHLNEYERFLALKNTLFLKVEEIKKITGLSGGAQLGRILKMGRKAQFAGRIRDREEAEEFVRSFYSSK